MPDIDTELEPKVEVSDEDKKLSNTINAAVKSQLGRTLKNLPDMLAKMLDERGVVRKESPESDETKEVVKGDDSRALKKVEKLEAELRAERQRNKEKEVMDQVKSLMTSKVRPEALNDVVKLLKHDGHIQIQKDGSVSFKHGEEEFDLEEGLSMWLKDKNRSYLLPAPGTGSKKETKLGFKPLDRNSKVSTDTKDPQAKTVEMFKRLGVSL